MRENPVSSKLLPLDRQTSGGTMERYLIETPHTEDDCLALLDQIDAQGYLSHFDWGCRAGTHMGWAVIEAESEEQARLAVPPLVRGRARVTRLNKFSPEELASLHAEASPETVTC
jgi:hypothetical protein